MFSRHLAAAIVLSGAAFASGCQSGASGDGVVPEGAVRASELRAHCPVVTLRDGTAFFQTYERGGEGDPERLVYQSSIADVTRTCSYGEGAGTITIAVAGRVVPGPKGRPGSVNLPIRIVASRGGEVFYSQLFQHAVTVSDTAGATQFIFTSQPIAVPGAIDRSVQLMVGFDEGPSR